jgi:uncharacterized membrane protein YhaH (DUF805 family)
MNIATAVTICLRDKYATFSGRASRSEFLWFSAFYVGVALLSLMLQPTVSVIFLLALAMPALAVSVRRLHDRNLSGWWLLIAIIPTLGAVVLFIIACLPSLRGANRFGNVSNDKNSQSPPNHHSFHSEWTKFYGKASENRSRAAPENIANSESWYQVLQVSPNADNEVIKAAYKSLIAKYHPDRVAQLGDEIKAVAERRAREINQAYETAKRVRGMQ